MPKNPVGKPFGTGVDTHTHKRKKTPYMPRVCLAGFLRDPSSGSPASCGGAGARGASLRDWERSARRPAPEFSTRMGHTGVPPVPLGDQCESLKLVVFLYHC